MADYRDYGYISAVPGAAATNGPLAEVFTGIARNLPGVNSVCDLGCGNGYMSNRLASAGLNVLGIDGSQSGVELARSHYGSDTSRFVCANIDDTLASIVPERFDLVVSSDVVEHLYHPADLVLAAHQLLNPGGYLLLGTPYHGYLKNLAISLLNKWDAHHTTLWDGGHIRFFSVSTLTELLCNNGFEVIRFQYFGRCPFLWKNMICLAKMVD